jgi:tnp2 family transposase
MENVNGDTSGDAPFILTTPTHCTHRRVSSGAICGEPLFKSVTINGNSNSVPLVPRLKYYAQDLKQWLGWLLSRPAIEDEVFKAFRRSRKEKMEDIWDGGHLCRVLLKKGERFLPGPVNETRLAFSFSMDSFNPYHMKESKQTVSSTAIWLILLNLPSHLRYRPENMFLAGIIPGPKKPSLSDINHSIILLADVLREFFDPGVLYSRTARHTHGHRVRAILVPVVADMLAARQAGGFASPTATFFCTLCNLDIREIENLDKRTWPERDVGEHGRVARQWRDAQTAEEQEAIFKDHGIRWSSLLSLPYWNPILFTAIEPMHVFDAGLFQTHCRQVWGIDTTAISGNGLTLRSDTAIARPSDEDMGKWYDAIRGLKDQKDVRERLKDCPREALWHICNDNDLRRADLRNRKQLVETIVEWVRQSSILYAHTLVLNTVPDGLTRHKPTAP